MSTLGSRFKYPVPDKELERRWSLVRNAMKEQGIDCLVIQSLSQFLGGYIRYFIDMPAYNYTTTVMFPLNEEMTVVAHGAPDGPPSPPDWAIRGIKERIVRPFLPAISFSNKDTAEAVVKKIKDSKYKKIGFVGMGLISADLYKYVTENIRGVEMVDATDMVDEIKAVKSPDEIKLIRTAIDVHDKLAEAVPSLFKPGRYEYQVRSELKKMSTDMGSEEQNIMVGTGPEDTTFFLDAFWDNRKIEPKDKIVILIEVNAPGGFYAEVARTWCLGEPSKKLMDAFDASLKAQQLVASMLKPGASPAEIFKANNDFLTSKGYNPEGRYFAHGQGYDMVERPALVPRETMVLKENMYLAIHPNAMNNEVAAVCCDNYLVTKNGGELLQKTPQKVFVL